MKDKILKCLNCGCILKISSTDMICPKCNMRMLVKKERKYKRYSTDGTWIASGIV